MDQTNESGRTPRASSPARQGQERQDAPAKSDNTSDDDDEFRERLERAKKLARSEITVRQWDRYKFCELDLDEALGPVLDNCERISCHSVSAEEFRERFEIPCKPCVITGLLDRWPAYHKWTYQSLRDRFASSRLKCGEDDDGYKVKIRLEHFVRYALEQKDDSPLYIFDADFGDEGKATKPLLDEFAVPEYFREDLFQYVGEDRRPPYRWILIGPRRSGSSIHIDPLATSAWNSVISGRKRWVLFPPGTPKALVKPAAWMAKKDREAIDWFLCHYRNIKETLPPHQQPIELITGPGETIFVPTDWWHTVLNLDDTIAVTQNFCSSSNFPAVWLDARTSRTKLSRKWLRELKDRRPDLYQIAQRLAGTGAGDMTAEQHIDRILEERKQRKDAKKARKEAKRAKKRRADKSD
eukprot:Tamp_11348.p1 GENE.Tamp_11348~~Tamp_11348.p1  ORF type:complete len:475 (+),score=114.07 Tamp_11348:193-1425(+)